MRLSLEHLSGARHGEVDTLKDLPATIGSGPEARILVPGIAAVHAEITRDGSRVVLRDGGSGQGTLVAGTKVQEIGLHDGDILELGSGGPRLRCHLSLGGRLFEHKDFQIALALVLLGGAGLCGWIFSLNRQVSLLQQTLRTAEAERQRFEERVEMERRKSQTDRASLENRIEEWRKREEDLRLQITGAARDADAQALSSELNRVRSRLVTLEGERAAGERIIREYGAGVCVLQGSYAFYDAEGRPLRYRIDGSGHKAREADGSVAVDVAGTGAIHTVDCVGTGFLVDRRGFVVTNRHVAEPWWKNDVAEALAKQGFRPRFLAFRAFFPRVGEALKAELHRVSPTADLAVLKIDVKGRKIPALPLDVSGGGAVPGQPVVVLGYPTGLEAILAKTDAGIVQDILSSQGTSNERITEALSRRGLIRPSTTQGHIGDVTGTDIVFDAPTTHGGSGGPVFNKNRRVIAVEYAVLPEFTGNSYGIPARYVQELTAR
jgi:hypothetical protein